MTSAGTLLCEVRGVVEAPVERVAALLLRVRPGPVGRDNCLPFAAHGGTLTGGPDRFVLAAPGHAMTVEVGPDLLAAQGGWWYRGEYRLAPDPSGTLLVHQVRNVAERLRWGVPLANGFFRGLGPRTRDGFAVLLDRVGAELGCQVRLLGGR
ncbi:hypothetical protein [Microbispora bryophytorum]|uniref:Uncharacterized protein n=1 Tax=Microbispora bryophytorum TaxID=1460882 RepID=A0A8H9LFM0_9ACTN|nr:hypothetical protein [Microbispora bryophytorum]MBD3137914.1 hypothetical protein [Microbispora bryophytorum]TQS05139.1 hypothetical protein FLX07_17685 [Microbispora bryophytorum]GGO22786.1 hypothetical protein GCM10011574_51430 [Microbispora bryophytorum]